MDSETTIAETAGGTPREVVAALAPPPRLYAITLRCVLAFDAVGCRILRSDPSGMDVALAWRILRDPTAAIAEHYEGTLAASAVREAVSQEELALRVASLREAVDEAFFPIPTASREADEEDFAPPGVGWLLHLADALMHSYSWSLDTVLDMPLSRAFVLLAAIAERNGCPLRGPSFTERALVSALRSSGSLDQVPCVDPARNPSDDQGKPAQPRIHPDHSTQEKCPDPCQSAHAVPVGEVPPAGQY